MSNTAIDLMDIKAALAHYEGQGRDRFAPPRSPRAITVAMLQDYFRGHGYQTAGSPRVILKYLAQAKNEGAAQDIESLKQPPAQDSEQAKAIAQDIATALSSLDGCKATIAKAVSDLITKQTTAAVDELNNRLDFYGANAQETEDCAQADLATAQKELTQLRTSLDEMNEEKIKAEGIADELRTQLENSTKRETALTAELATAQERAKQAEEARDKAEAKAKELMEAELTRLRAAQAIPMPTAAQAPMAPVPSPAPKEGPRTGTPRSNSDEDEQTISETLARIQDREAKAQGGGAYATTGTTACVIGGGGSKSKRIAQMMIDRGLVVAVKSPKGTGTVLMTPEFAKGHPTAK